MSIFRKIVNGSNQSPQKIKFFNVFENFKYVDAKISLFFYKTWFSL